MAGEKEKKTWQIHENDQPGRYKRAREVHLTDHKKERENGSEGGALEVDVCQRHQPVLRPQPTERVPEDLELGASVG